MISGSVELLKKCRELAKEQQENVKICIFDRDEPDKIKEATDSTGDVKDWVRMFLVLPLKSPCTEKEIKEFALNIYIVIRI